MTPTKEQETIYKDVPNAKDNVSIQARAGTGKSTTLVKTASRTRGRKIALAFNTDAAEDLGKKYQGNPKDCRTFHSHGLKSIRNFNPCLVVDKEDKKTRHFLEAEAAGLETLHYPLRQAISWQKNTLATPTFIEREIALEVEDDDEFEELKEECYALVNLACKEALEDLDHITFDDMIYVPAMHEKVKPISCDVLFIDEAQDINRCQALFSSRMKARKVYVGDEFQAIYGWRGASAEFLKSADKTYPLTVTFRCAKRIVALCQQFVPDIKALDTAPDGDVLSFVSPKFPVANTSPGDFVLGRTNASLVPIAFQLARSGIKAAIMGKGIGGVCRKLMRRLRADNLADLRRKLNDYVDETKGLEMTESAKVELLEVAEVIGYIASEVSSVNEIDDVLKLMFVADVKDDAVKLMTIHKSKGLESNRVFVLEDSLKTFNQEERNLCYVAYSRAKTTLVRYRSGLT